MEAFATLTLHVLFLAARNPMALVDPGVTGGVLSGVTTGTVDLLRPCLFATLELPSTTKINLE